MVHNKLEHIYSENIFSRITKRVRLIEIFLSFLSVHILMACSTYCSSCLLGSCLDRSNIQSNLSISVHVVRRRSRLCIRDFHLKYDTACVCSKKWNGIFYFQAKTIQLVIDSSGITAAVIQLERQKCCVSKV